MVPPLAVMPVVVGVPPPQAAMKAARLPYPAIFRTSRRERSRSRFSAASLSASRFRTRLASRESPIELLLPDQGHLQWADKLCGLGIAEGYRFGQICQQMSFASACY